MLTPDAIGYLERHPAVLDAACREIPDLFVWHVLGHRPTTMHTQLQRYMDRPGRVKRVQLPRNHGKTQQLSVGRIAWMIGRNPNIRVQIIQNNRPDAGKTVANIKAVLESERFQRVFPEVKPHPEEWGKLALSVKRDKILRDPTVSAQPIFGAAGNRADVMVFDDIENLENSIRQPALRQQVKEAVQNTWIPVLEPDGQEWDIGTPWHVDGITMDWRRDSEHGGAEMFMRACAGTVESPWPEKFPPDVLAEMRRKMGEIAYTRAYELKPLSGEETVFNEEDLSASARPLPDRSTMKAPVRWMGIDLAFSEQDQGITARKKESADPDWSVAEVADLDAHGHVWMVEVMRKKCSYPDWKLRALAFAQRNSVARVKIECNGPQKGLAQDMAAMFGSVGIACIMPTKESHKDKYSKACAVQAVVEQHRFHLRTTTGGEIMPDMRPLLTEMSQFPLGAHDDLTDVAVSLMAEARVGGVAGIPDKAPDYTLASDIEATLEEPVAVGAEAYAQWHDDEWGGLD